MSASTWEPWHTFLRKYQSGDFPSLGTPAQPFLPQDIFFHVDHSPTLPVFSGPVISTHDATRAAAYFVTHDHFAPPRSNTEHDRARLVRSYMFRGEKQIQAMQRTAELAADFFDTIVTVSLFDETHQIVHAVHGEFGVPPGAILDIETGICSHTVLRRDQQPLQIVDLSRDWRFKGNPWCGAGGLRSYVGMPICLHASALDDDTPSGAEKIPIGVLALMKTDGLIQTLTERDLKILTKLADGLSRDLTANQMTHRRAKEDELRQHIQQYLTDALIHPAPQNFATADASTQSNDTIFAPCSAALHHLRALTDSRIAMIVDISTIHRTSEGKFVSAAAEDKEGAPDSLEIVGLDSADNDSPPNSTTAPSIKAVVAFLSQCQNGRNTFPEENRTEEILTPLLGDQAGESLAVVLYHADQPHLLVIVAGLPENATYSAADADFLLSVGSITQGHLERRQVALSTKAQTSWLSQVTHELRTPLYGLTSEIEGMTAALQNGEIDEVQRLLQSARGCAEILNDVMSDVLDFGKLTNSNSPESIQKTKETLYNAGNQRDVLQLVNTTLRQCINRFVAEQANGDLSPRSIALFLEREDRLDADWMLDVDATGFMRILFNLVTNAFKYTDSGSIVVSLRLCANPLLFEVKVRDSGRGMDDTTIANIYKPFMQADTLAPGAGLGLFITKRLLERMHGTIAVESRPGRGSTFTVRIPVLGRPDMPMLRESSLMRRQRLHPLEAPSEIAKDEDGNPATRKATFSAPNSPVFETVTKNAAFHPSLRVLAIDDNNICRRILTGLLKRHQVAFAEASDGFAAVKQFIDFRPNLVWTDVNMPGLDGVTAAARMRDHEAAVGASPAFIIALTALGSENEAMKKEGLLGKAALDGWQVKGQSKLKALEQSLLLVSQRLEHQSAV